MGRIPEQILQELNNFISSFMGLHFTESRLQDLERAISAVSRDFGFESEMELVRWIISGPPEREKVERLAAYLTVGETYFFRDRASFKALEADIVPELLRAREAARRIRVWSAGCSTGEEPYSIAILLSRLVPDRENWNISILATDINPAALRKAQEGVYTDWSFRDTPVWLKERYFIKERGGAYRIDPAIGRMVTFSYLNLAEDAYPSLLNNTNAIDILFCRNVMMYFSNEVAGRVMRGFHNCVVDDGWLLMSPAEAIRAIANLFTPETRNGAIFYRKAEAPKRPRLTLFREEPVFHPVPAPSIKPVLVQVPPAPQALRPEARGYDEAEKDYHRGMYARAAAILEQTALGAGLDERGMLLLARAYANQGRLDEAATWCEKALRQDIFNAAAHFLFSTIMLEQGRGEEAVKGLEKAIYLDQDFIIAHFVLGNLLASQGRSQASERHYRVALKLLGALPEEQAIDASDGIMAGRLKEIITMALDGGTVGR